MEYIYPEIALKQPKADPRTVLLNKRNFIESSSDHIQEFHRNSLNNNTTTENCDNSKNIFKNTTATTTNAQICSTATALLVSKTYLKSVSSISSTLLSSSSSALSSSLSSLLSSTESSSSCSSSSSLLSTILVKFSKSCHFNASFNNNNTYYLYKTQKTTKLIFFLLLLWCAILIQTTQALPARRVATSGRKLILHTNVYRERYHQKLLEEQRQHNLQQQKLQLQLLEQQQQRQRQQQTLPLHPLTIHHHHHQQQQQQLQQQQPQQVQKNHIFSPGQTLRRHPQPQPHHRHHLHQRAAPPSHHKMSVCKDDVIYEQLHRQMNASVSYIKNLCASYLKERGNETFEGMSETWKLISLETRNPNRKAVPVENMLHKEIVEFYLNLHNFDQLIDYASQDTNKNKTKIEHGEEINIDNITKFFETVKNEIKFNMLETNTVLDILQIEKPDLADNKVEFNSNIGRRIRDFLIIKNLIEEFERILQLVQNYCENNRSE
ncbi:alpha-protein kinase 1-like isoform X1 [Lucilia cuprina]|uniref:alpha-protein kinase 1-like isoform X1 n=1 Tax=Lucilia cuprina TaxID=7375 RepID=UPI001F06931B|nr:alpha-protein kinase 1-like isoform X1 [Lucilia cuprina]